MNPHFPFPYILQQRRRDLTSSKRVFFHFLVPTHLHIVQLGKDAQGSPFKLFFFFFFFFFFFELESDEDLSVVMEAEAQGQLQDSTYLIIPDLSLLDCPACHGSYDSRPIHECVNGHTTCSKCYSRQNDKCHVCLSIRFKRCVGFENFLESLIVPCRNGCEDMVYYMKRQSHEDQDCVNAPCQCPISNCSFSGRANQLGQHLGYNHKRYGILRFKFDTTFYVSIQRGCKVLILKEEKEELLFLLTNGGENMFNVTCMAPSSYEGRFFFEIEANTGKESVKFESCVETRVLRRENDIPSGKQQLSCEPNLVDENEMIHLDVCIYLVEKYDDYLAA
ncbi:Putative E3 ubiquitin-protein ligase SINA-like 9 [Linum perenne]